MNVACHARIARHYSRLGPVCILGASPQALTGDPRANKAVPAPGEFLDAKREFDNVTLAMYNGSNPIGAVDFMKLTTKMRYGTRAMLDLALHEDAGPITLKDIAQRQEVSVKYVEHLLSTLHASGLLKVARGRSGGYSLSRPASEINLRQVYEVLEGTDPLVQCTEDPGACHRSETCATQEVWAKLQAVVAQTLESITLDDLARRSREKGPASDTYYI
jgi:Rrf2 family protein